MVLLHGDGPGRTSFHTEAALDAAGFFFKDDGGEVTLLGFFHGNVVERFNQSG